MTAQAEVEHEHLPRRAVAVVRGRVMRAGAQDWPVVGSLLRRLDKHLP